jgi:hypothetical protein
VELNTIILWVIVGMAVSVVMAGAWSALIAAGREGSGGGPQRGSLERDDDEEPV